MNASRRSPTRRAARSLLFYFGISVLSLLAYVALWKWVEPGFYLFLILGTYAFLGGFAVVQLLRALRMGDWRRRVGAFGVVVGFAVAIFLGLRPRPDCLDFGPCLRGLALHPLQLALGMLLVTASLYLDRPPLGRD